VFASSRPTETANSRIRAVSKGAVPSGTTRVSQAQTRAAKLRNTARRRAYVKFLTVCVSTSPVSFIRMRGAVQDGGAVRAKGRQVRCALRLPLPLVFRRQARSGERLRAEGKCTARSGVCVAVSDEDCAKSSACRRGGRCGMQDGKCVATAETCKASEVCSRLGQCSVKDGRCAPRSSADCRQSIFCQNEGECSVKGTACVVASDADCRNSGACKASNAAEPRTEPA